MLIDFTECVFRRCALFTNWGNIMTLMWGVALYPLPYSDYAGFVDPIQTTQDCVPPCHMNSCVHIFACIDICMHILLLLFFII